ncbi:hypothetical protein FRB90_007710 [Tulasnella sp. 427]|nr:hypothetical protein FRB90_007710 [Tulasnella sp. 427]
MSNPLPLQEHERAAVNDEISQLWVPFGSSSAQSPSSVVSPSSAIGTLQSSSTVPAAGIASAADGSAGETQLQTPSQVSSVASIPPGARSKELGPGQAILQFVPGIASTSGGRAPGPSTGVLVAQGVSGKFKTKLQPWEIYCKCANRTKKPSRHWKYSCPYNEQIQDLECQRCGQKVGRPDNLERHQAETCPGQHDEEAEGEED